MRKKRSVPNTQAGNLLAIALLLFACSISSYGQGMEGAQIREATYHNPVIPGELPDPSIIRVGERYYAVGTSFNFAPTYPIYESTDLINWQQIGAVFPEPPAWASKEFWAPELVYKNGTYYVYYTAKRKDTGVACIGVATTDDLHQGFEDRGIIIEWGEEAIDAYVFDDVDGKRYISWKAYGLTEGRPIELLASELSTDGLRLVGEHFTLTDHTKGWRPGGDEGQCILRHGDYYYMLYSDGSCCDNRCDYRIMVARSRALRSGWEQLDIPILEGGEAWRCPGHGTLVTTPDDRYFYLYHAYRATDFEYVGRQGMLDELAWDEQSGWPYMVHGPNPTVVAGAPFAHSRQLREQVIGDYFSTDSSLSVREWDVLFPRPYAAMDDTATSITPAHEGYNFLGFRAETGNYSFEATVEAGVNSVGIGVYTNQQKLLAIAMEDGKLMVHKVEGSEREILAEQSTDAPRISIKYAAVEGRYFKFYWSPDGSTWNPVMIEGDAVYDATYLATWGYSPRVGVIVKGSGATAVRLSGVKVVNNFVH